MVFSVYKITSAAGARLWTVAFLLALAAHDTFAAADPVEGQPLAANARRVVETLEFLGYPLEEAARSRLVNAVEDEDPMAIQNILDEQVLFVVDINPELRVKVSRGPAPAILYQSGYTPALVKVRNQGQCTQQLRISSPQAGPVYRGAALGSLQRQQQEELAIGQDSAAPRRFLDVDMFYGPPMTDRLGGLAVEYAIALIYSRDAGKREATIEFDVGQGTQDIGFRGQLPVLFDIRPAVPVRLALLDQDGSRTVARLVIRDKTGRVYPPQAKRLAPDFFFQPQIYRADGESILLPPGEFTISYSRGPEYRELTRTVRVESGQPLNLELRLQRWIDPSRFGYYSGDHHIHAAGCAHYQEPTQGVTPQDMFRQVKGEGLNVGCVLTWGPCYDYQRRFFAPSASDVSEPLTVLKYDLEISGFGSAALGHVCLLNLQNDAYPGTNSTTEGWPTWTVPVLRWAKEQGGVTGFPHSDMYIDPRGYAEWIVKRCDEDGDQLISQQESQKALLPAPFLQIDTDEDQHLSPRELQRVAEQAGQQLPNLVLPAMRGAGAMEIFVAAAEGVCDFISAMDTGRIGEWNTWYHLLNAGVNVKLSGETDFPCMSSRRVGQGRVYVKLADAPVERVDFQAWCRALQQGRSYVSDGYAHAPVFRVSQHQPGEADVQLSAPGRVTVSATVAFAPQTPLEVAHGTLDPHGDRRAIGDTRVLHGARTERYQEGGERLVEVIVNGQVVASTKVPADGQLHDLQFVIPIEKSSWVALRQFPQLHTNPVNVLVDEKPIRASRQSALWCAESIRLLWENRSRFIADRERQQAWQVYQKAIDFYEQRAAEAN